ncbi:alpha/beta-hydrolase, partial [Metschnikowia bicuspidata var. bicuspidata NRRL YB-4993]
GSSQKDYLVTGLPGMAKNIPAADMPLMYAGQLPLYENNNTHYFFWKFVDRHKSACVQNRTIFWLNGGPGCLLMDGALMEAGPFRVNERNEVTPNSGLWHRQGDVVFVDQPAGTGFSYGTEYDAELADVLWHFLTFLDRYFALFPEDLGNDIVLAGESYAGQYIPYIARAVLDRNARVAAAPYRLAGLLIGNGYISPNEQGLSFVPFAVKAGMVSTDHPRWRELLAAHQECQSAVDRTHVAAAASAYSVVARTCDRVLNVLLQITADRRARADQQCFNMYDHTLKDLYPACGMNWPPDLAHVTPFLAQDAVMEGLNLRLHTPWTECLAPVGAHLKAKRLQPAVTLLSALLDQVRIVLFHGNRDVICNYMGAELMLQNLEWDGHRGFSEHVPTYDWRHDGAAAGYLRSEGNLTYVNVFNASHMVPYDKPEVSRAMVDLLYRHFDVRAEEGKAPQLLTYPVGREAANGSSTLTLLGASGTAAALASGPAVRVIQLAVIVVLIWGVCALYTTYRARPTSIIKTKPAGRKKNVMWADQLELGARQPSPSLLAKALGKFK